VSETTQHIQGRSIYSVAVVTYCSANRWISKKKSFNKTKNKRKSKS